MSGLLICAVAVYSLTLVGALVAIHGLGRYVELTRDPRDLWRCALGLALIAAALYLAWRAGGAGA